jgi:hypothetical protein
MHTPFNAWVDPLIVTDEDATVASQTFARRADSGSAVSSGGVTDHGALSGLTDDDHTQYAKLAGRSGGQTVIGGTGATDDLTLQSTSHGTLGQITLEAADRILFNAITEIACVAPYVSIGSGEEDSNQLRFYGIEGNYVALQAPATMSGDNTYRLPAAYPAVTGYVLSCTDAGVMSWAASGGVSDGDKGDIVVSGSGATWTIDSAVLTTAGRNLIDDADNTAQRTTLGLGTIATQNANSVSISGGSVTGITDLVAADGGTGRSSHTAYAVICGGTTTTAAQQSIASVGTSGQVLTSNGAGALPTFQTAATVLRGYIDGLTLSNAADADHDITVAVGTAADSTGAKMLSLASAMTKRIDATWAAGTTNGGLFSGSVANTTWYHFFIIEKDSDGSIDAGWDTSLTAANKPAGYTKYRRVGSVLTNGSANIIAFSQHDNEFLWLSPPLDVDVTNQSTTAVLRTLSVPPGLKVWAIMNVITAHASTARALLLTSPDANDEASSTTAAPLSTVRTLNDGTQMPTGLVNGIRTNTSGQIRSVSSNTNTHVRIATLGWTDPLT